jgi:hypothetical protein
MMHHLTTWPMSVILRYGSLHASGLIMISSANQQIDQVGTPNDSEQIIIER